MDQPNDQQTVRDAFRSSLEDSVAILRKLAPHCGSVDELIGMLELACHNDGQLGLLMREITPVKLRQG